MLHQLELLPIRETLLPTDFGWEVVDGQLTTKWDTEEGKGKNSSLRQQILKKCCCKKSKCISDQCSCHRRAMLCSQLCLCVDCENEYAASETEEEEPVPVLDDLRNDDMNMFDMFFDTS